MFITLTAPGGAPWILRHETIVAMSPGRFTALTVRGFGSLPAYVEETPEQIKQKIKEATHGLQG